MICFFEMSNKVLFLYFPNFHITYVKLVYHYCRNLALFIMAIFSVNHFLQPRLFFLQKIRAPRFDPKLYIPSTPNNSNETHTFMCLGKTGCFGQR